MCWQQSSIDEAMDQILVAKGGSGQRRNGGIQSHRGCLNSKKEDTS